MFQNIKADIIYYKTNTDFELEFNLCGCCRMRLLTDKSPDKKVFVHSLSRAVSRSRIIIISGILSGDDGLINVTSNAIGKSISKLNKETYGIKDSDTINIIDGSTPLVTPEGNFGGCIIESGPQTMILISDNKDIRKTIMESLIHPYIEELAALDLKAKASSTSLNNNTSDTNDINQKEIITPENDSDKEIIIPDEINDEEDSALDSNPPSSVDNCNPDDLLSPNCEAEETKPEPESNTEKVVQENKEEKTEDAEPVSLPLSSYSTAEAAAINDEVELDGGMIFETDDYRIKSNNIDNSYTEKNHAKNSPESNDKSKDFFSPVYSKQDDYDNGYHIGNNESSLQKKSSALNITIMIISIFLLALIAVICYCMFYIPSKNGISVSTFFQETFKTLFG